MYTVFLKRRAEETMLFLNTMVQYATIIIAIVDEINWTIWLYLSARGIGQFWEE